MRRIGFITWGIASFVVVAITQPIPGNGQTPPSSQDSNSNIIRPDLVTSAGEVQQGLSVKSPAQSMNILPNPRDSFVSKVDTSDQQKANFNPNNLSQAGQVNLSGDWIYETYYFGENCRPALELGSGKGSMNIVQQGNQINIQGGIVANNNPNPRIAGTISGNQFSVKVSDGNTEVFQLYGLISSDGNQITGDVFCYGRTKVPFTLTRKNPQPPQPVTPQTIEQKRAFRKSDQQVAAELAALRERGKREGWTFEVGDSQAFRILLELLNGTRIPANFRPNVINILDILTRLIQDASRNNPTPVPPQPVPPRPIPNPNQLPNRFDAREWGVVPAIRTQGNCGSCWAFAAVSAQEIAYSSLYKQPSSSLDLSEQQLLSCNRNNFSCSGGFISDKDSDYRYESGLVGEQAYPYEKRESTCRNFSRPGSGNLFDIKAFQFIDLNDDSGSPANITKIKQAIYAFGVVWAGVHSDEAFHAYKGTGVFNACSNGKPNHAINIIGWDDAGGYWIVRNSWGNDWGENGYMKIKYGCSQIGVNAAIPKLPVLADCNGGNCQPRNYSTPPWLGGNAPTPVAPTPTPPISVPPISVPPTSVPPTSVPPVSNPNPPNDVPPGYNW
ncbi:MULTISPECIES: C1 family peptidase [unclassified Microcoleus]|uniref:C1 family peptidase n=1 Tax=unclassified Microcoleus TaxID=2642155 RepID=UPI002FD58CA0